MLISDVRLILNLIWFFFCGLWMAIGYVFAALICFLTIVGIPFGFASLRIASFALWPFGRTLIRRPSAGVPSALGNVIWVVLCGWWLALGHIVTGLLLCVTIIGIPLGLANFKLVPVSFLPLGREIVSNEQAARLGMPVEVAVAADPRAQLPPPPPAGPPPSPPPPRY
jgi:uncharacterized membrane protein YccF (DUF307 family)